MADDNDEKSPDLVVGPAYVGTERRTKEKPTASGKVRFDERGNAVWEISDVPRRRADDDTLTPLKALAADELQLVDQKPEADEEAPKALGFNPYDRS